jgi:flagellar basal-body rod modification protein FlgD
MSSITMSQNHQAHDAQSAALGNNFTRQAASSTDTASASSISSNDFLTLLVTELKNQDPTANSDPNQYVNQLVQVNSLEQLIQINDTLTSHLSSSSSGLASGGGAISSALEGLTQDPARPASQLVRPALSTGNLATPSTNPAAQRVAQALAGRAEVI